MADQVFQVDQRWAGLNLLVSGTSDAENVYLSSGGAVVAKRTRITRPEYSDSGGYSDPALNLDIGYTYNSYGRQASTSVPFYTDPYQPCQASVTYTTGYDSMGRPLSLVTIMR